MMKLEHITRFLSPSSIRSFSAASKATSVRFKREDVITALSYASSACKLGIDLYLARMKLSSPDNAIKQLYQEALLMENQFKTPKNIDQNVYEKILKVLCIFAYEDYSKDAASVKVCTDCEGEGFISANVFRNSIDPVEIKKISKTISANKSSMKVEPINHPSRKILCKKCKGKGAIRDSCLCQGRGLIVDRAKTVIENIPVYKQCERCKGRGFSRIKFSAVLKGVQLVCPVKKTYAYQYIRPFYEQLVALCHQEEANAEYIISKIMK